MLLKIAFFVTCFIFADTISANQSCINDQINNPQDNDYYFMDVDNLEMLHDSDYVMTFKEKKDPSVKWVFFPLHSWMRDFDKVVASVVAVEFHRRIDEHALAPITKFLVGKDEDNSYHLWGSVYKKIPSTSPFREEMHKRGFDDPANSTIYGDHKIERIVSMWRYLNLPQAPDYVDLGVTEDNGLVRDDYYNAFQYYDPERYKHCFCTSLFLISDYNCDTEYMKIFEQELRTKHEKILKKIISEIGIELEKYPKGKYLQWLTWHLERVVTARESKVSTEPSVDNKHEEDLL